jgi:hypothetical protein
LPSKKFALLAIHDRDGLLLGYVHGDARAVAFESKRFRVRRERDAELARRQVGHTERPSP